LASLPETADTALEHGWLLNGKALAVAMSARSASGPGERRRRFDEAFGLCFEALALVRELPGEHADYLRFNLQANLTFLLEITHRPALAAKFWRGAFGRFAALDSPAFAVPYHARLGQLLGQAGDADADDHFVRALAAARVLSDRFYAERIAFARAYAAFAVGRWTDAVDCYLEGAGLAAELCDESAYRAHVIGAVAALVTAGRIDAAAALAPAAGLAPETVADLRAATDATQAGTVLRRYGVAPARPSPKLPPYIASVDLEGAGAEVVNRVLLGDDHAEPA
jgi:hypothetical protein